MTALLVCAGNARVRGGLCECEFPSRARGLSASLSLSLGLSLRRCEPKQLNQN